MFCVFGHRRKICSGKLRWKTKNSNTIVRHVLIRNRPTRPDTRPIKRKIYLAKRHVADGEFDKQQKEVLRYIESSKGCTKSMLYRKFRKLEKRKRTDILDNLVETQAIRKEHRQTKNSRQTTPYYVVNKKSTLKRMFAQPPAFFLVSSRFRA